jgi:ankyrin repeat protein
MKVLLEILGRDTKRLQLEPESFNIALLKLSKKETDDKGRVDALKALLEKGNPDIDCRDRNFGCTPLIWAIRLNQVDVWTLLISKGASLTVRDSVEDRTPLMWAAATREGSFQVAGALLTKSQARPYLNDRDRSGKTALDLALDLALALKKNGDYKTCKLLCAYGAERG